MLLLIIFRLSFMKFLLKSLQNAITSIISHIDLTDNLKTVSFKQYKIYLILGILRNSS